MAVKKRCVCCLKVLDAETGLCLNEKCVIGQDNIKKQQEQQETDAEEGDE